MRAKAASWVAAQPARRRPPGRTSPVARKCACENRRVQGGSGSARSLIFRPRRICRAALSRWGAGFALWVLSRGLAEKGPRARDIPRTTIACTRNPRRATGRAIRLCGRRYSALTTSPALWRSRNQNNPRTEPARWCRSMLRGCRIWGLMTWPCSSVAHADIPRSFRRAPDTRAWAAADRQGSRLGTAARVC